MLKTNSFFDDPSEEHSGAQLYARIPVANSDFIQKIMEANSGTGSQTTLENIISLKNFQRNKFKNAKKLLNELRRYIGFNISELATILLVKRPTIYEWLESNNEPSKRNQDRLDVIHSLFEDFFNRGLGTVKRYFYKKTATDATLLDLLKSEDLNPRLIRTILQEILEAVIAMDKSNVKDQALLDKEEFEPINPQQKLKTLTKLTRKIGQ